MSLLGFSKTLCEAEDASIQSTRLLCISSGMCLVAAGSHIHLLDMHEEKLLGTRLNKDITRMQLRARVLKKISTEHINAPIQSICMLRTGESEGKFSVASVDSVGNTSLSVLQGLHTQEVQAEAEQISYTTSTASSSCSSSSAAYASSQRVGWAGITSFAKKSVVATCVYLDKKFTVADINAGNRPLRCLNTMKNPTAIIDIDENCIAISEGGLFSMWDSRVSKPYDNSYMHMLIYTSAHTSFSCLLHQVSSLGGFVSREPVVDGFTSIWTLCPSRNGTEILAAGSDRNIYIYDVRNLSKKLKCSTPCKFDVVKILSSSVADKYYVCGHDNEVLVCDISQERYNSRPPHEKHGEKGKGNRNGKGKGEKRARDTGKDCNDIENEVKLDTTTSVAGTAVVDSNSSSSKLKEQHERGFKAQSNWIGVDVFLGDNGDDTIHGVCDLGNVYMLKHAQLMGAT